MKLRHKLLLYALMTTFTIFGATAHEIETGVGLSCDTADQVRDFAAKGPVPDAIKQVNDAAHGNVCALVHAAFIKGAAQGEVRIGSKTMAVTEILVVGFFNGQRWQQLPPIVQFTLFPIEGEPA